MGVRVLLEELGVEYRLREVDIRPNLPQDPELLELNPNGWVPVLQWEDGAIYECGAILVFLCDRHPQAGLAPEINDPVRGEFLQWIVFFSSAMQTAYQMTYYRHRFVEDENLYQGVQERSCSRLRELWQVVDDAIGERQWLLGESYSAVDIYLTMLTSWMNPKFGHPEVREFDNVFRIVRQVLARPAARDIYDFYVDEIERGVPRPAWWPGS